MTPPLWVVAIEVPRAAGEIFADAFSELSETFTCFEAGKATRWRFEAILDREPDRAALEARFALLTSAAGIECESLTVERLPEKDWLAENRTQFPPVEVGRFFVYGSYFQSRIPPGRFPVMLDVGMAFGSGTHGSTRGCLLALDGLSRRRRFRHPLDLGTGSGILAITMAQCWRVAVAAVDVDPVAVRVARGNAARNSVARLVRPVVGGKPHDATLRRAGAYDLIVANILARPLEKLAPTLARALARKGMLVLSGILASQAAGVVAAYRAQGICLKCRIRLGDWTTLVLRKP